MLTCPSYSPGWLGPYPALLADFLNFGVDRTLTSTTMFPSELPQIFSGADCKKLQSGTKTQSQSPTKKLKTRSDTEVEGDADEGGRQCKRQKKDVVVVETAHRNASQNMRIG